MQTRTQRIIALRRRGLTRPQIAARLGISENVLGSHLHWLLGKGIIKPMRLDGKSYRAIGKHFGVSGFTVAKVIGSTVRITPLQRQLIRLHGKGLTYQAIAAKVGKPAGTVAVVLARLVKKGLLKRRESSFTPPIC